MKSLIHQGVTPYESPATCFFGRKSGVFTLRKNGRLYRYVVRDRVVPEDPYFVMVKAAAFAIRHGEPYNAKVPKRALKDFMIKSSVVI